MISLQGIVLSKWADTLKNMQHNEFGVHFRPVKDDEKEVWKHVILNEGEQLVSTVDSDKSVWCPLVIASGGATTLATSSRTRFIIKCSSVTSRMLSTSLVRSSAVR